MKSIATLVALLLAFISASAAAERSNEKKLGAADPRLYIAADGSPRYDRWVRDYFDERFRLINSTVYRQTKHKFSGMVVVAKLRMWQVTGEQQYLREGREQFGLLMSFAPGNPDIVDDCFGFYPVVLAGKLLKRAGQFDPAWEEPFHACVRQGMAAYAKSMPHKDGNQDLARFCAMACALGLYPEEFIRFRAPVEAIWKQLMDLGDLWLDSKTYTPVSVQYLVCLADELGRVEELRKSAGIHRMLGNFRDVLSPNGYMPEFGHAYFKTPGLPEWLYVFEWAGALYDDPTFLYAARKFFNQLAREGTPRPRNLSSALLDCHYALAGLIPKDRTELITVALDKCKGPPVCPELISGITRRKVEGEGEVPAFLILRGGLEPGSPMLMMDLLSWGDHALYDQRPSIGYYETGHVPHFYQYGRYAQAASRGNVLLLKPANESFPDTQWAENRWRTIDVPLERFAGQGKTRHIDTISLRTTAEEGRQFGQTLFIDNIRLSGPAGERKLFDFEDGRPWAGKGASVVGEATSGHSSLKIPIVHNGISSPPLDLTVSLDDFTTLSLDAKWTGKRMVRAQLRPSPLNASWTQLKDGTLFARVRSAVTAMRGRDCWARIEFAPYATYDSRLIRQIVLTQEGVLCVRDDVLPGKSTAGMVAGSLWQMYSVDARGSNWFSTRGERPFASAEFSDPKTYEAGMLAYFPEQKEQTIGLQEIPEEKRHNTYRDLQRDDTWRVAYSRQQLQPEVPAWFSLLVQPHAPETPPNELVAAIHVVEDARKTTFQMQAEASKVVVSIDKAGQWGVEREPTARKIR